MEALGEVLRTFDGVGQKFILLTVGVMGSTGKDGDRGQWHRWYPRRRETQRSEKEQEEELNGISTMGVWQCERQQTYMLMYGKTALVI